MSGTMQPPMAPPGGGMGGPGPMGGGGAPQIPPQVLAMLAQRMQGGGGAPGGPPMMPGGAPGMVPHAPPPGPPGNGIPAAQGTPMASRLPPPGMMQQAAAQGRGGDQIMAHLTPGEIQIPPAIQTPQLMAAIRQAFAQAGLNPAQFVAGSPTAGVNPATGVQEFNSGFLQFLPAIAGGVASIAAPELIPAIAPELAASMGSMLAPAAAALAAGGTSAATGGTATQAMMSGIGSGAGAWLGGLGGAGGAGTVPATNVAPVAATSAGPNPYGAGANPEIGPMSTAAQTGTTQVATPSAVTPANSGQMPINYGQAFKAGIGAGIGQSLAPTPQKSNVPDSFNKPMQPLNPQFGQLLGSNQANRPTFTGYNPYQSVTGGGYSFYPTA
jgi:hypothetical protein